MINMQNQFIPETAKTQAKLVKLLAFDIDGVMNDGLLWIGADAEVIKPFHVQDGFGISLLHKAGIQTAIITGRSSKSVQHRADELNIQWLYHGCKNKRVALTQLCQDSGIEPDNIAYVGDDWPDLPVLKEVGLGITVPNGRTELKQIAAWITNTPGGHGVIREISEMILKSQNKLDVLLQEYR